MNIYDKYLLPHLINCACSIRLIGEQRALLVPRAHGQVLEVGAGSGLNFPYYDRKRVGAILALEPSAELRRMASLPATAATRPITFLDAPAEEIPLEANSIDTVLMTYTLCTIPQPIRALSEMRRALKPGGLLLFAEHGRAPDPPIQKWQDRLTPTWKHLAGGCHLNRDIPELIERSGFDIQELDAQYLSRPKAFAFNYRGLARAGSD